jgi:hypothetical protein
MYYYYDKYRAVEDPVLIWKDLCTSYGFQTLASNQLNVLGTPRSGQVTFSPKVAISCLNVKIPHYVRSSFVAHIADEPWKSGEVVLPIRFGKEDIWKHLQTLTPRPHHSQFQIISNRVEISHLPNWPAGLIELMPKRFPVTWHIEWPSDPSGFQEVVQQDKTPMIDAVEARQILRTQVPGLYEDGVIACRGKLRPGQMIQVEVQRCDIQASIRFEIRDHGYITFTGERISNMSPRSEIHAQFARADDRMPPYVCYLHEDVPPYHDRSMLSFHLRKDVEIPDTAGNGNGAAGRDNGRGKVLPPVIYPTASIDVSEGKLANGKKGPVEDSFPTDSSEDEEGQDVHKLTQIAQAIHQNQPVTIAIQGQFQGMEERDSEVLFQSS